MLYLPISKSWMISPTARRVYLLCAIAALYLLAAVIGVIFALTLADAGLERFPLLGAAVRAGLLPGIVGAATLWVAMWYFWFSCDDSGWLRKAIWFVVLFFFTFIGSIVYFFAVYRRAHKEIAKAVRQGEP